MTFKHAEQAKMLGLLRQLAAYRNMAHAMQEVLTTISDGDANAQQLATDVLAKLNKEYGNGLDGSRKNVH